MSEETRSFVEEARREKLTALRETGVEPFAYGYSRTHTTREALDEYDPEDENFLKSLDAWIADLRHETYIPEKYAEQHG